ncbi:MAG: hypothetical protein IJH54_08445 [Clostridia bacterium]|nr:hypothetical protein [Clostridia bacterium]
MRETVREFSSARPSDLEGWSVLLHELCQDLDLCRPVILGKHMNDLKQFSRVVFKPRDFIEPVDFDEFELEILSEKKKRSSDPYSFA